MENGGVGGGGEIENERPLVQRARPTGSTLLFPLFVSPLLASPHRTGLSRARGFVTRVSPSVEHLSFSVSLSPSSSRPAAKSTIHRVHTVYISLQKFRILAKMRAMET